MAFLNSCCLISKCIYQRLRCNNFQQIIHHSHVNHIDVYLRRCRPFLIISQKFTSDATINSSVTSSAEFRPIYKFPQIVLVRALCRLKLLQTTLVVGAVPISFGLYNLGFISDVSVVTNTFSVGLLAMVMLYVMSEFTRRAIGMLYIDHQGNRVRIAYLDFWGNRRDIVVPLKDIVPLTDAEEDMENIYVKLCRYSTKDVLYLCIKYGIVLDKTAFQKIFGSEET